MSCQLYHPTALGDSTVCLTISYTYLPCDGSFHILLREYHDSGLANLVYNNAHCFFSYTKHDINASLVSICRWLNVTKHGNPSVNTHCTSHLCVLPFYLPSHFITQVMKHSLTRLKYSLRSWSLTEVETILSH